MLVFVAGERIIIYVKKKTMRIQALIKYHDLVAAQAHMQ